MEQVKKFGARAFTHFSDVDECLPKIRQMELSLHLSNGKEFECSYLSTRDFYMAELEGDVLEYNKIMWQLVQFERHKTMNYFRGVRKTISANTILI